MPLKVFDRKCNEDLLTCETGGNEIEDIYCTRKQKRQAKYERMLWIYNKEIPSPTLDI